MSLTDHRKSIKIDKDTANAKLIEYVDTINIYESIFTSHINADISFIDGASFKERFNISGDEDFEIEFLGYGNLTPLNYKLKVVEMANLIPNNNLRAKNFTLRLTSPELLIDSASSIAKSYSAGTKIILQDIIQKFLGSRKQLFVEETKDPPTLVIPYMSPFQAIDFVRQRSVSSKYKSSTFLFFETNQQYNFVTIEGLLDRGSKAKKQKFMQREDVSQNVKGNQASITDKDSFHLFFNYTVKDLFNLNNYFKNGAVQSVVTEFDITTKKVKKRLFQNVPGSKLFFEFADARNPDISTTLFNGYSKYNTKPFFVPFAKYKDSNNPTSNFVYDTLLERVCYANLFTHEKTYIDIPGNTLLKAGDIIELEIPKYEGQESKKGRNDMDSGMYLITSIKHTIKIADSSKYDTHLELMRFGKGVYEK
jgi:hypothetical protein